jgi:hypothetical protein
MNQIVILFRPFSTKWLLIATYIVPYNLLIVPKRSLSTIYIDLILDFVVDSRYRGTTYTAFVMEPAFTLLRERVYIVTIIPYTHAITNKSTVRHIRDWSRNLREKYAWLHLKKWKTARLKFYFVWNRYMNPEKVLHWLHTFVCHHEDE